MAVVNVDLSEYDMLRESKKKAENEIIELKKEIEEYKKNARVIVTTKKCYRMMDAGKISKLALEHFRQLKFNSEMSSIHYGESEENRLYRYNNYLQASIDFAIRYCDTPDTYVTLNNNLISDPLNRVDSSTEIKGFEDVRLKVEEVLNAEYKQELDSKLIQAKNAKEHYEHKYEEVKNEVEKELHDKYDTNLSLLETELATKTENIKKLNQELYELKEEYNKYKEDTASNAKYKELARGWEIETIKLKKQLSDLEHELKVAKEQVEPKKHWWNF